MSIKDRYLAYAEDFEKTYVDGNWTRIEQYFTADAVYDNEPAAKGREAVLEKLKGAIGGFDQLMDSRNLKFEPAAESGDKVSVRWTARYTKTGAPDLVLKGVEHARFKGDRIEHLSDVFDPGVQESIGVWMAAHGASLQG